MTILVFGASSTYGAWDIEGGWVQRLRKFLDYKNISEKGYFLIYNLGISGDNTENLLERFKLETKFRLKNGGEEKEETAFIFSVGTNDSQFIHSKNSLRVPPEKFKDNLQSLINSAKQFSEKIVFVGLTPVEEPKTTPIPWDIDKFYKNEYIQKYDGIIKKTCKENNLSFVEVFEQLKGDKNLSEDGLHPNSEGHRKIFETVKDFLIINKILSVERSLVRERKSKKRGGV